MGCGSSEVSRSVSLQPNDNLNNPTQNQQAQYEQGYQKSPKIQPKYQQGTMSPPKQGINQSPNNQPPKQIDLNKYQMTMIGITKRGPTILSLTSNFHIEVLRTKYTFPRYGKALISNGNPSIGFLTGGVDDLEINVNEKATIDLQILEGEISKKFIQVNIAKLLGDPDNAFTPLPDMSNARYAHCSIQMNDKLFVIGGRQYGGIDTSILKECEMFDFKTQKWSAIPSLFVPRSEACCIQFNQHIYLFGGCTGYDKRTRLIESYSIGDAQWRKLPFQLPEGIQSPAIVKSKETQSVLIFGGKTDYGKSNRVFEIDFNKSTILGHMDMEEPRCNHKISQNGDVSYLIGGGTETIQIYDIKNQHTQINYDINYLEFCSTKEMNSFSQFQPQISLVQKKRKYETPNFKHKVFMLGHSHQPFTKIIDCDKFVVTNDGQSLFHNFYQFTTTVKVNKENAFVLGGINSDFTEVTDAAYSFNLLNEEIKYLEPMKNARYGMTAIVKGSYLYVIGGRKIGSDDVAILNQCERFSFQSYKWESIAPLKTKRHSAFAIVAGDNIVVIGGYKGNGARISDIEIYIEEENRWVELDDKFDLAIEAMCPVVFENQIYLFGGRNENNDIQKVFKLKVEVDQGVKYQKSVNLEMQPVGNLSYPGTNLRIFTNPSGICYVFGNIEGGIDVYDLRKQKVIQREQLVVFQKLKDKKFQSYTIIF